MTTGADNTIDERTFEHLNALADGELDEVRAARLRQQMQQEPELQQMYDRILSLKSGVKQLHEEQAETQILPMPKKPFLGMTKPTLPIAASIVALTFATALLTDFTEQSQPEDALGWHQTLSKEAFDGKSQSDGIRPASIKALDGISVPDLEEAQLKLASYRLFDKGSDQRAVLHYRGPRSCKLTLWIGSKSKPMPAEKDKGLLNASWTHQNLAYHLVALGMDKSRFADISNYVKQVVTLTSGPDNSLVQAQIMSSNHSAPCT